MAAPRFGDVLHNKSDLNRIGLAQQEQFQDRPKKSLLQIASENSGNLELLLRSLPDLYGYLADVRRGLRTRWNAWDVFETDTNAAPSTNNQGELFDCRNRNGGIPWDSFTIDSVGGAGTTMQALINERGRWVPVSAGDVFDNGEIWSFRIRVTTAGSGTGRITVTSYIPGIGGLSKGP